MHPLKSSEIFGNWATLLLPIDSNEKINYDKLAAEIDVMIASKVNGIYSNGTAGEFYNQTEEEFDRVNELLAEKCNASGVNFQIGCCNMSPVLTLERVKRAVTLKPGAIQVILPDWFPPTMKEIIGFLKRIADAADGIGIVLYNPPHSKVKLKPADFAAIAEGGVSLVGCKMPGGNEEWYSEMKRYATGLSVFIPGHHLATGITSGAHGAYSNVACIQPAAAQRWYEQMKKDMGAAMELQTRIQRFMNQCIVPYITDQKYSNQAVDKLMAAAGGWTPIEPRLRWPYSWIPNEEVEKVRTEAKKILPEFFNENYEQN